MQLNNSTIQPRKGHQKDKYQGQVHPVSKLRHGMGIYQYDNKFFTYEGSYVNGRKNGQGVLKFKDGRIIKGTFVDNELIGPAEIIYSDGSIFEGSLEFGQRSGKGIYKSLYQNYDGEWLNNQKHGYGWYKNLSNQQQYKGEYYQDKPHGKGEVQKWNYSYKGDFKEGLKQGSGIQINDWCRQQGQHSGYGRYVYNGSFKADKFQGQGQYRSRQSAYVYNGQWQQGRPILYPNEFRLYISTNTKNGEQIIQNQKTLLNLQPIEYEIQGDSFNLYIQSVYQGPEVLDENQPTPQEIDLMIKNWQNENKKNKNPPPMPDFNQPKMKKPQMIIVEQQTGRNIQLRLIKQIQGKDQYLKIDYRQEILTKRKQNQQAKIEALKKAQEEGNKKGGKKDNKGEVQLKVNIFKDKPTSRETILKTQTCKGRAIISRLQFPDDIPQGKYFLQIKSLFIDFGQIKHIRKQINIKSKQAVKKK